MTNEEPTQNTNNNINNEEPDNLSVLQTSQGTKASPKRYRLVRNPSSYHLDKGSFDPETREKFVRGIMKHKLLSSMELLRIFLNRTGYLIFSNKLVLALYSILFIFFLNFLATIFIVNQDIRVDTPGTDMSLEVFINPEDDKGLSKDINALSVSSSRLIDPIDYFSYVFKNWEYRKDVDLFNFDYVTPSLLKGVDQKELPLVTANIRMGSDILDMQMSVFISLMKYRDNQVGYTQEIKVISVDYPKNYEGLWNIYPDDTITSINGQKITDALDVEIAQYANMGVPVSMEIERQGNPITVVTELPSMELGRVIAFTDPDYYTPFNRFANLYTKNIEGRSAGVSTALSYYDTYIEKVSKGRKIALSGILNPDGTITPIAGVNLKTIQAINNNIDILFFANDISYSLGSHGSINIDNYSEAKRTLERYDSDITLVGVDTFEDIITYLKKSTNSQEEG